MNTKDLLEQLNKETGLTLSLSEEDLAETSTSEKLQQLLDGVTRDRAKDDYFQQFLLGQLSREEAEAAFLSEVCGEVFYFPMYSGNISSLPKSVCIVREKVTAVETQDEKKLLRTKENVYYVDGVFILREAVAPGQLVPGLETEGPHVTANRRMETSIPGVFACGDIAGLPYQYIKAAGEGNVAALSAVEYLDKQKRRNENG